NSTGEQKVWIIDLKEKGQVSLGSQEDSADCTLFASDDDIVGIMTGQLDSTEAFFDGRLKIDGDMGLAMKLNKLQTSIPTSSTTTPSATPSTTPSTTPSATPSSTPSATPSATTTTLKKFKSSEIFEKISQLV